MEKDIKKSITPAQQVLGHKGRNNTPANNSKPHLQKILNSFGQSEESFSKPLKEYFTPSASLGRNIFHTFKKY